MYDFFKIFFSTSTIKKRILLIFLDTLILIFSFIFSMTLRLDNYNFVYNIENLKVLMIIIPLTIIIFLIFKVYTTVVRYVSSDFIFTLLKAITLSSLILLLISQFLNFPVPRSVPFIYFITSFIFIGGLRLSIRSIYFKIELKSAEKVAILGNGELAQFIYQTLIKNPTFNPLVIFDNEIKRSKSNINEIQISEIKKIKDIIQKLKIDTIFLTDYKYLNNKILKNDLLDLLKKYPIRIRCLRSKIKKLNQENLNFLFPIISIEDLLERSSVFSSNKLKSVPLSKKRILITGAGGSIGSELAKQILINNPSSIYIVDHSEYALYQVHEKLKIEIKKSNLHKIKIKFFLGSIQNNNFLTNIFNHNKIDIIFHAAAYKHVTIVEQNISEAVNNNVFGTFKLIELSIKFKVGNFILISSDKAVRSSNVMGATKRLAELMCQAHSMKKNNTKFSIVRFGNVIGSSGSVIPIFKKQIASGGPVTVTHKDVTRFFMSIEEAINLVLQILPISKGGEVFLLDMKKPLNILDLAIKMIHLQGLNYSISKDENNDKFNVIKINITGLRDGEKMHEELSLSKPLPTKNRKVLIAKEKFITDFKLNVILSDLLKAINKNDINKIFKILEDAPLDYNRH